MGRGKKFDAAEKHFQEKLEKLRKEKDYWRGLALEKQQRVSDLETELETAKSTVEQQREWIERLLQYTELSKEEIRAACEKDKNIAACAELILGAKNFFNSGLINCSS